LPRRAGRDRHVRENLNRSAVYELTAAIAPPIKTPSNMMMMMGMMAATMTVPIDLPVVKSQACLTAITAAMIVHIQVTKGIMGPMKGMKLNMLSTPGE